MAHVLDTDNPPTGEVSRQFDALIVSTGAEQIEALGYKEEPDPEKNAPDILVPVTVAASSVTGIYYDWAPVWG